MSLFHGAINWFMVCYLTFFDKLPRFKDTNVDLVLVKHGEYNINIRGMSAKFVYMYRIKQNRRTSLKQITLGLSAICWSL